MYIRRHMEQLLEQITAQYPVLLVTGPRQVGKAGRQSRWMTWRFGNWQRPTRRCSSNSTSPRC